MYEGNVYPYVFGRKGMARLTNRLLADPYDLVDAENINFERERVEKDREAISFGISLDAATMVTAMKMFNPNVITAGAGTISVTAADDEVVGVGTSFTTAFQPGDRIVTANEELIVDSIASNTSMFTQELWGRTAAGVTYSRKSSDRLITVQHNGRVVKYTYNNAGLGLTAVGTSVATGIGTGLNNRPKWVQGGQETGTQPAKLFLFTGTDTVKALEAETTFAAISTPPADWTGVSQPVGGVVHRGRLVGFGNSNSPHRVYFSLATDHEDFTAAGTFQLGVFSNIGQRIFNAAVHNGVLFLWKWPVGMFYLDDTDLTTTNWAIRVVSESLGCAPSPHAVLPMDDDVLFCDASGHFHLLSAVNTLGGVRASDLTRALGLHDWTRDNINTHTLYTMNSAWDPVTKIAYFSMPDNGDEGGRSSKLLKFDFGLVASGGPVRFSYTTAFDGAYALAIMRNQYVGDPGLLVSEEGLSFTPIRYMVPGGITGTIGGTGYVSTLTLPVTDFADLDPALRCKQKIYDGVELIFNSAHLAGVVTLSIYVDGLIKDTVTFNPGGNQKQVYKKLNVGQGYNIQITLTTDTAILGLTPILGMNIYFREAGKFHSTPN